MLLWLKANLATILICLVLAVIVFLIVRKLVLDKKQGKSTCGCGCENCKMHGQCHQS